MWGGEKKKIKSALCFCEWAFSRHLDTFRWAFSWQNQTFACGTCLGTLVSGVNAGVIYDLSPVETVVLELIPDLTEEMEWF